jgi:hypothetical protein
MVQTNPDMSHSKIRSEVKPIVLGVFEGGFASFNSFVNFRYETNFGYATGDVKTGNSAREDFNLDKNASYLLKVAGGTNGVEVNYLIEHFQYGTYDYYTSSDEEDPKRDIKTREHFETKRRQIEVLYHFTWKDIPRLGGTEKRTRINDTYFGYRYTTYKVPKIYYEYETYKEAVNYNEIVYESSNQFVETRAHIIGGGVNNFTVASSRPFSFLYTLELFGGYGEFKMKKSDLYSYYGQTVKEAGQYTKFTFPFVDVSAGLGFSSNLNFGPIRSELFAFYKINWYIEYISKTGSEDDMFNDTSTEFSNNGNSFHLGTLGLNFYF